MPGQYVVGDTAYQFPDDFTDDQVHGILSSQGIIPPPSQAVSPPPETPPRTGPQLITEDQLAAPPPMTVQGGLMKRTPGTTVYKNDKQALNVPEVRAPHDATVPTFSGPPTPDAVARTQPIGQYLKEKAETPLIDPENFTGQNEDNALGYGVDAAQSGLQAAAGMTSPENIAILVGTMGLSAVPGILAKLGSSGVSAYFATQAGKQAMQQFPELKHHAEQGDWHAVAANAGAIAANALMTLGAGAHAVGELHGAATMPPAEPKPQLSKVKTVSPATPNPPTAATPTTAEAPQTIAVQMQQMGRHSEPVRTDQRKAVMFPKGEGMPTGEALQGLAVTHDAFGNTYAYRPDLTAPGEIHAAAKNNTLPELLGGPQGMGAPDKSALEGPTAAVVGRAPDGTEVQSTGTDAANLEQTIPAVKDVTPPGGTVSVEPPSEVLGERESSQPAEEGVIQPKPELPQPQASSVVMGSMFGGLDPLWHESVDEMRALKAKRDAANAEIERAKATPGERDFGQKVVENYTGERDFWSARANQLLETARKEGVPDKVSREALSLMRDFKNRPQELQQFATGTHPDFQTPEALERIERLQQAIDLALHPTPGILHADKAITSLTSAELSEGQRLGFLDSSLTPDEYVRHLINPRDTALDGNGDPIPTAYSGAKDFGRAMGGKIGRRLDSAQKRTYPTLLHAVGEGLVPKTLDAIDAMTINSDKFATARATHMLINQLRDLDVGKWGGAAGKGQVPEGWVEIAPHAHPFRNTMVLPDKNGEPAVFHQTLFVPKYISDALRPITDPDYTNKILGFARWRGFNAYTKAIQLGMSLFHAATENHMAAANMGPLGWLRALGADRDSPAFLREERDGILHGLTTPIQGKTFEAYKGLQPGSIPTWGDIWRRAPAIKQMDILSQKVTDFTFGRLQRQFKVQNYALEKAAWIAKHPNATPMELNSALHSISKQINSIYGGLHWENMGVNKASVEFARAIMLAPDWTFSNIANLKYAGEKGTPAGKMARAFWIRAGVHGLIGTQLLSLALSGHTSKNPTMVYMGKDSDGKDIFQNVFFKGAPGDMVNLINNVKDYGAVTGVAKTMMGKANPVLRTGLQLGMNQNYLGQPIVPKGSGAVKGTGLALSAVAKGLAPVPLSAVNLKDMLTGPGHEAVTLPEFFTTALAGTPPRHLYPQGDVSPAEQLLIDYRRSQAGPGNAPTDHSRASTRVFLAARTGDIAKARTLGRQAVASGTMAPKDIDAAIRRARSVPLVDDLKTLTGPDALNVTMRVYEAASPEERIKIQGIVRHKLATGRIEPYKWNDDTRELADKYFHLRPVAPSHSTDFSSPTAIQ